MVASMALHHSHAWAHGCLVPAFAARQAAARWLRFTAPNVWESCSEIRGEFQSPGTSANGVRGAAMLASMWCHGHVHGIKGWHVGVAPAALDTCSRGDVLC